jgi:hypothetical protein
MPGRVHPAHFNDRLRLLGRSSSFHVSRHSIGTYLRHVLSPVVRARLLAWGFMAAVVVAMAMTIMRSLSAPATIVRTAPAGPARSHCCWIVRPGQTLYSIAARESVTPAAVERLNPRLVPARLVPGQRVRVPA